MACDEHAFLFSFRTAVPVDSTTGHAGPLFRRCQPPTATFPKEDFHGALPQRIPKARLSLGRRRSRLFPLRRRIRRSEAEKGLQTCQCPRVHQYLLLLQRGLRHHLLDSRRRADQSRGRPGSPGQPRRSLPEGRRHVGPSQRGDEGPQGQAASGPRALSARSSSRKERVGAHFLGRSSGRHRPPRQDDARRKLCGKGRRRHRQPLRRHRVARRRAAQQ